MAGFFFCACDEPKSVFARDLVDRLQSRNVPFGTSGDYVRDMPMFVKRQMIKNI